MNKRCWLLAVSCWLVPAAAAAAPDSVAVERSRAITVPPARPSPGGTWWIGAWAATANNSRFVTRHGYRDRDLQMAGIRVGRQLGASRRIAFDYFVDVVPWILSSDIPVEFRRVASCAPSVCTVTETMETATVRGYGLTPVGLQLRAFPGHRVELVLGMSAGAAIYDRPVPDPDEMRLNFMGDLSAGVQLRLGRSSLLAGIRHNHTSNANTGRVNPGLDSRVLYLGIARPLGGRPRS